MVVACGCAGGVRDPCIDCVLVYVSVRCGARMCVCERYVVLESGEQLVTHTGTGGTETSLNTPVGELCCRVEGGGDSKLG